MLGHEGIVLLVVNLVVASSGMRNPKRINGCVVVAVEVGVGVGVVVYVCTAGVSGADEASTLR